MSTLSSPSVVHRYDSRTIRYHWLSAVLVFGLWLVGKNIDSFSSGDPRVMVRSLHITFGVLLGIILVLRIVWRMSPSSAKLPPANQGVMQTLTKSGHGLLYALMIAVVVAGVASAWIRGDNLFNLFSIPKFPTDNTNLRHSAVELHELLANALLIVALLHGLTAMWHQWGLKDNLLARMGWGQKS